METSTILTIGLLGIWCSMCVDDKDTSDQRMLGYALGFGLLFILVCKNLYSEEDEEDEEDEECSIYEYASNQTPDEGFFNTIIDKFEGLSTPVKILGVILIVFIIVLVVNMYVSFTEYRKEKKGRSASLQSFWKDGAYRNDKTIGNQIYVKDFDGWVVIDGKHKGRIVGVKPDKHHGYKFIKAAVNPEEALTKAEAAAIRARDDTSLSSMTVKAAEADVAKVKAAARQNRQNRQGSE